MKLPNRVSVALIVVATTALFTPNRPGASSRLPPIRQRPPLTRALAGTLPRSGCSSKMQEAATSTKADEEVLGHLRRVLRKRIKVACKKISPPVTAPLTTPAPDVERTRTMCNQQSTPAWGERPDKFRVAPGHPLDTTIPGTRPASLPSI